VTGNPLWVRNAEDWKRFVLAKVVMNRRGSSDRREPSARGTLGVSTPTRKRRKETPVEREQQYVGIDLHRRRSVIVRMNDAGEVLAVTKIDNDPLALAMAVAEAGPDPEVSLPPMAGHLPGDGGGCWDGFWWFEAAAVFGGVQA
jgi:hypothetical protein